MPLLHDMESAWYHVVVVGEYRMAEKCGDPQVVVPCNRNPWQLWGASFRMWVCVVAAVGESYGARATSWVQCS